MYDSLLYYLQVLNVGDTTIANNAVVDSNNIIVPESVNFLSAKNIPIEPILQINSSDTDIISIVLLILLGLSAVVRYSLPDRFSAILSLKSESQMQRAGERNAKIPGTLILGFFWLNFIISMGIFLFLISHKFMENEITSISNLLLLNYIFIMLILLYAYRIIVIYGTATIFKTQKMMKEQVAIGRNIQFLTGVFLLPVILLILYAEIEIIIYIAIVVVVLLQLFRILKIAIIGKSSTIFSALHIILYLCTLEIVPVLVLIRLIANGSGI